MTRPLRIAVASSGLGHVARGIEAWADDLAAARHARGQDMLLCKGAGVATHPYERVAPAGAWQLGLGSRYGVEPSAFALNLIRRWYESDAVGKSISMHPDINRVGSRRPIR